MQRRPEGEREREGGRMGKEARQLGAHEWLKSAEDRKRACETATWCTSSNDAGLEDREDGPGVRVLCCALG